MKHSRLSPQHSEAEIKTPRHKDNSMAMSVEQMRVLISRKGLQSWIDEQCKKGCYIPDYEDLEISEPIEK